MKYALLAGTRRFEMCEGELRVRGNPVIKVTHAGVCGTDLSAWKAGDEYAGLIIGHEYAGVIEEPGTSGLFQKGDRVAGYTQNVLAEACGHCAACLAGTFERCDNRVVRTWKGGEPEHPGAYSEYTTWFSRSIHKLPDSLGLDEAALIEPFAVGLHAVMLSGLLPGDKVLVLGGGIIGLAVTEWARHYGAASVAITEMNKQKAGIIQRFGIVDAVFAAGAPDEAAHLLDASDGGYDIVFDCVGQASAVNTGIAALKKAFGKTLVAVALPRDPQAIDYRELVLRQVLLKGSKGHTYSEFLAVARAAADKKLDMRKYISKRIRFADVQKGFEEIDASGGEVVKAILEMA